MFEIIQGGCVWQKVNETILSKIQVNISQWNTWLMNRVKHLISCFMFTLGLIEKYIFDWDVSCKTLEKLLTHAFFGLFVGLPLNLNIPLLGYQLSWFQGLCRSRIRRHFGDSWLGRSPLSNNPHPSIQPVWWRLVVVGG